MNNAIRTLEPKAVWEEFDDICQIPRPSKKEGKIIAFLLDFGEKLGLETSRDKIGNVLIRKPATEGMENLKTVILQSHMDMVCEKNTTTVHDFDNDPIQAYIDNGWVKANGTTLGADDGIGMAAEMALLKATNISHGPIECLFTVDEETGLTGAFALQPGFLEGKILLNLDSEDEGELFIGCAGGVDTLVTFDYKQKSVPKNSIALKIEISGLQGGHSGDEIHKGLGNSNIILNRFLNTITRRYDARLAMFDGGNLRNAIPREAYAIFTIKIGHLDSLQKYFEEFSKDIKNEIILREPSINLKLDETEIPEFVINRKTQKNLVRAIYACPHGVHSMSPQIEGLVETSTNLASVKFAENNHINITTSQRSSLVSGKEDIANKVESVFRLAGAKTHRTDGYPGWAPNRDSEILRIAENTYEKLFSKKPLVRAIHAGLECGLFLEKYPDMDMISFGPTLRGVHSPDEKIEIETVEKFWDHLLEILKNIPAK